MHNQTDETSRGREEAGVLTFPAQNDRPRDRTGEGVE